MLDLGTLRLGIKVDGDEAKAELNKVGGAVTDDEKKTTSLMGAAKNMIKAFAAAWAVKELVKLGKAALDAYADFEQLEGGVKKIFGDEAAEQVMKNAERAYKTAGVSANEYMEQVTSFSASLIQSLDGDTVKAAEVADMAIRDMSDNANTFGTDIASIQNAYQGFAKQNYTMLDNLKLGYGGTKQEMERLLEDAEELTGMEYDISNLDDVYEAIHAIQVETKVAGTTAKEAGSTISGSVQMMKASWQNLLITLGTGEGLDAAIDNFLSSLGTMATNIIPRVITIAGSVVKGLVKAIPKIMQSLAKAISKYADTINSKSASKWLSTGVKLLKALLKGILQAAPALLSAVVKLAGNILKSFANIDLTAVGKKILNSLLNGLKAIWGALTGWLSDVGSSIRQRFASINLWSIGRAIISSLFSGLTAAWGGLSSWVSDRVSWIKNMFSGAKAAGNAPARGGRPGYRIGLREVPYDGYMASLHKGETVLTAAETNRYKELLNAGTKTYNGGDITVNVYGSDGMSVSQLASAVEQKLIQMQKRRTLAWQ